MNKLNAAPSLSLFLLLTLAFPTTSHAAVEVGAGFAVVSFEDDLKSVDTDAGPTLELTVGSGVTRLMVGFQSSSHNQGDYEAWMVGPSFTLGSAGFSSRIYAGLSGHEFEGIDGWGVTLGGGIAWPVLPAASFGFDARISRWDGDGPYDDIGTGTLQVLFKVGF